MIIKVGKQGNGFFLLIEGTFRLLRLRRADQRVGNLAFLRAPRRVARTLLDRALGHGYRVGEGMSSDRHLTRQELAALAGMSRETLARLLTKFQQVGVLTVERRKFLISDWYRVGEWTSIHCRPQRRMMEAPNLRCLG